MNREVENGDVNSGKGYMNRHAVYYQIGFKKLIIYNYRDDIDMNAHLHNGDESSGIGLVNIHTINQFNESSNLDEMDCSFEMVMLVVVSVI